MTTHEHTQMGMHAPFATKFLARFKERARNKQLTHTDMLVRNFVKGKPLLNGFVGINGKQGKPWHAYSHQHSMETLQVYGVYLSIRTHYYNFDWLYANSPISGICQWLTQTYGSADDDPAYQNWLQHTVAPFFETLQKKLPSPLWHQGIVPWYEVLKSTPTQPETTINLLFPSKQTTSQ